jgi:3-phytase
VAGLCAGLLAQTASPPRVQPLRATEGLPMDVDDPAVWVNRADSSRSLVFGTMKVAAPEGALAVFGLDGRLRQLLKGPDRPNNVDVEYGLDLDGTPTDIVVLTERVGRRLRAYGIARNGEVVRDLSAGSMAILAGAPGDEGAPMGIGLYKRLRDGAIFAIVSPKSGPTTNYLWQYRLQDDGTGRIGATFVRRFGAFSGIGEIEAIAVDDELGYVYYADEGTGIHKWAADPDSSDAGRELALFATTGYQQDREGIGIYCTGAGRGYIVAVDQLPGESVFHVYKREGEPGRPHDHSAELFTFMGGADGTDGLEVESAPLGSDFPDGLLVAMNSAGKNFLFFRWGDVMKARP